MLNEFDQEVSEAVAVSAFVFIVGIIAVAALVCFSIYRDNRTTQDANMRLKQREFNSAALSSTSTMNLSGR